MALQYRASGAAKLAGSAISKYSLVREDQKISLGTGR
jgi:hypothetical protein